MQDPHLDTLMRLATTNAVAARELEVHGLSFSELRLLSTLEPAEDGLRPTELASHLEVTASGVTRAVLPLEKRGILKRERDPHDARASRVALTAAGRTQLEEAIVIAADRAARLLRRLSLGQIRQLERLLSEIG
jgi:DNA-binding MarR family transcriptional regulator